MEVLITRKYENDWIKNIREKFETPFFPIIRQWEMFRCSRTDNYSVVAGPVWPKFGFIQDLMHGACVTCNFEKEPNLTIFALSAGSQSVNNQ